MDNIGDLRAEIADVDAQMAQLFEKRFGLCGRIASIKEQEGLPVRVPEQEKKSLEANVGRISDPLIRDYYSLFLQNEISLSRSYQTRLLERDIVIERGALSRVGTLCGTSGKVLIITDSGVPYGYVSTVAASFSDPHIFVIQAGEEHKDMETVSGILEKLLSEKFTRGDALVAVGGGLVGDVAGFAASCYMRGIEYYNVPTTLLAQVDSSVGGKTAVNFGGVKNLVGAFHNPSKVIIDPDTLETLSPRLFSEGVAEMIKMAATSSAELFDKLSTFDGDNRDIAPLLKMALDIKLSVVRKDPCEEGLRRVLNFGHTVGHAIESASGGCLYHGECVAIGMLYMCSDSASRDLRRLLDKYGLPHSDEVSAEKLCELITYDKKSSSDGVTVVWVEKIGNFEFKTLTSEQIACLIKVHKRIV